MTHPKEILFTLIVFNLTLVLNLTGVIYAVIADSYVGHKERKSILIISALSFSLLVQSQLDYLVGKGIIDTGTHTVLIATAVSVFGYCVRPLLIMQYISLVNPDGRRWPLQILVIINTVIYLSAFVSPLSVSFTEDASFRRGSLSKTCAVISFILLIYLIVISIISYNRVRRMDMFIPVFCGIIVILVSVLDMNLGLSLPISFLAAAIINCCVFYYLWLHLKYARDHEKALLAESRIQLMMSQIQPHFLYNTLATIQALCDKEPRQAAKTVEKFANYLRQNLDSLSRTELVPLKKELEHARIYTDIELLMYPVIDIEYDISDDDFLLPALTIQPLIENSIRHGVRNTQSPHVIVSTYMDHEDGSHIIQIADNGRGFDTDAELKPDSTHIGIRNVRERIEKMCDGTLDIESSPGQGCIVTISIPAKENAGDYE